MYSIDPSHAIVCLLSVVIIFLCGVVIRLNVLNSKLLLKHKDAERLMGLAKGPFVCIDCNLRYIQHESGQDDLKPRRIGEETLDEEELPERPGPDFVCQHWRPEHWEKKGFKRDWGDASLSGNTFIEVLRFDDARSTEYVVLAPRLLRRPAKFWFIKPVACPGGCDKPDVVKTRAAFVKSWGSY